MTVAASNTRTMAFQIPENLFQRIKVHLERETRRTGRNLTQREFVLGLVEAALKAERQAGVGPCEVQPEGTQDTSGEGGGGRMRTRQASPSAKTSDSNNRAAQANPNGSV